MRFVLPVPLSFSARFFSLRDLCFVGLAIGTDVGAEIQNDVFASFSTSLKGSASRLTRMAKQGDTVAVLKVAGICAGVGVGIWLVLGWIF